MGPGLHLNAPAIAELRAMDRRVASRHIARKHFGQPIRRGRSLYVAIDAVERWFGCEFSPEQIESATAAWPTRSIRISA